VYAVTRYVQRMAVWLVRDCVIFTYHVIAKFRADYTAPKTTETLINYTACCKLVFIIPVNLYQVFSNLIFYLNQSALTLIRSSNLFCFFVGGQIPNPPLKAVTGLAFVSSLASFGWSVARVTCQCANKKGWQSLLLNNLSTDSINYKQDEIIILYTR